MNIWKKNYDHRRLSFLIVALLFLASCVPNTNSKSKKNLVSKTQLTVASYSETAIAKANTIVSLYSEVKNDGPGALTNVVLKNVCPTGTSYNGNFSLVGSYDEATGYWSIPSVNADETITVTLECYVPESLLGQTVKTSLELVSSTPTIGLSSESTTTAKFSVRANLADVKTVVALNRSFPLMGEQLTYLIKISNSGPDTAFGVNGTYTCPSGTTYNGYQLNGGVSFNSGTGKLLGGDLANGASLELSLQCTVNAGVTSVSKTFARAATTSTDNSTTGDGVTLSSTMHSQCSGSYSTATKYNLYGDGLTAATAFEIGNADQLIDLQKNGSQDFNKKFILCSDIDFTGKKWAEAIGNSSTNFSGEFNGNSRTISHLSSTVGLFGHAKNIVLKNLTISNSTLSCIEDNCAFFIRYLTGDTASSLTGLQTGADTSIESTGIYVGGIVGKMFNAQNVTMTNLTNRTSIVGKQATLNNFGTSFMGGIVGAIYGGGVAATSLSNNGNLAGDGNYMAGIASFVILDKPSSFTNLINTGNITLVQYTYSRSRFGGIFGEFDLNPGTGVVTISNSVSSGSFTAGDVPVTGVGGFVGYLSGEDSSNYVVIDNSSVTSDVVINNTSAVASSYTGGFVGAFGVAGKMTDASIIKNSISRATINGSSYAGGFVGLTQYSVQIQNCASYGDVISNTTYVGGFAGRVDHYSKISNSQTYATSVTGGGGVGGFVGYMANLSPTVLSTAEINGSSANGVSVNGFNGFAGGFVGYISDKARIINSSTTLTAISAQSTSYAGGFIGLYDGQAKVGAKPFISYCTVNAAGVTLNNNPAGLNYAGGFIGRIYRGGILIENSSTNLNVSGESYVGGFVGLSDGNPYEPTNFIEINNSQATGNVLCEANYCGGFVGSAILTKIDNSSASGSVTAIAGSNYNGGFAGQLADSSLVSNSTSTGAVSSVGIYVGGFVGNLINGADVTDSKVVTTTIRGKLTGGFIGQMTCGAYVALSDSECKIQRNYVKATEVGDLDNGSYASSTAGGFIAVLKTMNGFGAKAIIEDNFVKVTDIKTLQSGGGFISNITFNSPIATPLEEITIARNYVAAGTLQMAQNVTPSYFGGFVGLVTYTAAGNAYRGKLTIEDNYTKLAIDTTKTISPGAEIGLGGFLGYHSIFAEAIYRRNYAIPGAISGNTFYKRVGGFAGSIFAGPAGYTEPIFQDNITAVTSIEKASTSADFFLGVKTGTPVLTNNYYNSAATCTAPGVCNGTTAGTSVVLSTLYNSTTTAPLNNWDFTNVWQARVGQLPALRCSTSGSASFCTEWNSNQ